MGITWRMRSWLMLDALDQNFDLRSLAGGEMEVGSVVARRTAGLELDLGLQPLCGR
jgi:hypothetical protein